METIGGHLREVNSSMLARTGKDHLGQEIDQVFTIRK
jgi:hypothetical protein